MARQFSVKFSIAKFHKNRFIHSRVVSFFRTDRQTDRQTGTLREPYNDSAAVVQPVVFKTSGVLDADVRNTRTVFTPAFAGLPDISSSL
jgi:hypothetical protein